MRVAGQTARTVALMVVLGALGGEARGQDAASRGRAEVDWSAQVRAGVEYDSNATRVPTAEAQGDLLMRYFGALDVRASTPGAGAGVLSVRQGGKAFATARGADTLLTLVNASWQQRLARHMALGASLSLKDRTERTSQQDYTRFNAALDASWWVGRWSGALSGGYGVFAYKPNRVASSQGAQLSASGLWQLTPAWRLTLAAAWLDRGFDAPPVSRADDTTGVVFVEEGKRREDRFASGSLGAQWRGPVVVELLYTLASNRSNSYGQDLLRHTAQLVFTAPLVWELLASGRVELQRTSYNDPVLIDANFRIDEDNRNALVLSLARPFGEGWDVEARYSLYTQEFGAGEPYRRQMVFVSVGYVFDP